MMGGEIDIQIPQPAARAGYYEDIALIAYPSLESEIDDATLKPVITSSDPACDIHLVNDGNADQITELRGSAEKKAWIQFDFGRPRTIRSLLTLMDKRISLRGKTYLQSSNNGVNFKNEREIKMLRIGKKENGFEEHFEGITARYFRVETDRSACTIQIRWSHLHRSPRHAVLLNTIQFSLYLN